MGKTVGIDLGTTNSVVAVMEGGEPVVITTAEGTRTVPSVVGFKTNGERVVGAAAKRQAIVNPQNTVSSIKRFMGHSVDEVRDEIGRVSYAVKPGKNGQLVAEIPALGKEMTPEELSAAILQKLKADAEAYLGQTVDQAVITVPAYFNDAQRNATKNAGEIAGLKVLRIINEPTAAALAYGLDKKANETILVFDLGGGTFDVSILDVGEGVFEVRSTAGDSHLGGDDFDNKIVQHLIEEFKKQQGVDLSKDPAALQRLKDAAEKAKVELSGQVSTNINLPYITMADGAPQHLDVSLTRAKFEELTRDLMDRVKRPFQQALDDARVSAKEVDEVVLVGGSTRMPQVQNLVKELTGKEPNRSVNPDEVVAVGAAIQAGVLGGEVKNIVLLDVTPLSLGVETQGGVFDKLIERNTTIPTKKSRVYTTAVDNQPEVEIHILQGERPMARDNKTLGRFHLAGIPPMAARMPQIEVTFDIDANGILNVSAQEKGTGSKQSITITGSSNLSRNEIDRMVSEAEANAELDTKIRDLADLRNRGESLINATESTLKELGDKVDEATRGRVNDRIRDLRDAIQASQNQGEKLDLRALSAQETAINAAFSALETESHAIGERLYKEVENTAEASESGPTASKPKDDTVDAEFKED